MRLIDADALKADYGMKDDCADCEKELRGKVKSCEYEHIYTKMDFCGWIDSMPTIEERKTGKWIHGREIAREMIGDCTTAIFYDGWTCSECGCLVEREREPLYKYCPNCGSYNGGDRDDIPDDIPIEYFESGGK